jgi:hypothetical protein
LGIRIFFLEKNPILLPPFFQVKWPFPYNNDEPPELGHTPATPAIMMYRIINGLVAIESPPFMHHLGAATRGRQQQKYIVPYSRTTVHKESFFPSTIRLWNQLPEATSAALDLESFKKEIQAVRF